MSLTNSEIAILVAPVATTCAALCMGAAVYVSVMRRRRSLSKYQAVAAEVASKEAGSRADGFVTSAGTAPPPRKPAKALAQEP